MPFHSGGTNVININNKVMNFAVFYECHQEGSIALTGRLQYWYSVVHRLNTASQIYKLQVRFLDSL